MLAYINGYLEGGHSVKTLSEVAYLLVYHFDWQFNGYVGVPFARDV